MARTPCKPAVSTSTRVDSLDAIDFDALMAQLDAREEAQRPEGSFTLAEFMERAGISRRTAAQKIKRMIELGLLEKCGKVHINSNVSSVYREVRKS